MSFPLILCISRGLYCRGQGLVYARRQMSADIRTIIALPSAKDKKVP